MLTGLLTNLPFQISSIRFGVLSFKALRICFEIRWMTIKYEF